MNIKRQKRICFKLFKAFTDFSTTAKYLKALPAYFAALFMPLVNVRTVLLSSRNLLSSVGEMAFFMSVLRILANNLLNHNSALSIFSCRIAFSILSQTKDETL